MAYTIDRYNNSQLTVVEDGTIDQTTDLKLVGKNYAGYGEIQNENFVFLLENFSGANPPPKAISGQIWFDSSSRKLKFYDGTKFRTTGGAEVSAATPAGLTEGDFWWDTANEQLYAYNGADFILVGPQDAGDGVTQMQSRSVRDTESNTRSVIVSVLNDEVIHIISSQQFTIDSSDAENAIPGFDVVRQGLTLKNTINSSGGATTTAHRFWGTASNADKLGGISADNFVQTGDASFDSLANFSDFGIAIGDSNDLKIDIQNDNQAVIANEVGTLIIFKAKDSVGTLRNPLRILANSVIPGLQPGTSVTETVTLGSADQVFSNVYATTFTGKATTSATLFVDNEQRAGSSSTSNNTVAVRTSSGDIFANLFRGTATSARYADLAEKYTMESEYSVGTVVAVCEHEEHEMAIATPASIVAGVISEKPAFLMNEESDGQAVALKGKVPVRIYGPVKKGQAVKVYQNGLASTDGEGDLVGIALESNDSPEEKLVECFLKV